MTEQKNPDHIKGRVIWGIGIFAAFWSMAIASASSLGHAESPKFMTRAASLGGQLSFADLVEQVSPAVVSIRAERYVQTSIFPGDFGFFRFNFKEGAERQQFSLPKDSWKGLSRPDGKQDRGRKAEAGGSGFFIDQIGHLVTNHHVVEGAEKIFIKLHDGREKEAVLVGMDDVTDLAVLKVDPDDNQPHVRFADDVNLRVGDWVLAVGSPFGLGGTVTSGIVSALGRDNSVSTYLDFIQIDAPINRGNSGGPTFDLNGRVVGVNTAIYSPSRGGGSVGIGFAIPGDTARRIVTELIDRGSITRGWLGVGIQDISDSLATALGMKSATGALVSSVVADAPAAIAGFEDGDVVVKLGNELINDAKGLSRLVGEIEPGKSVRAEILRGGKRKFLDVRLGKRDEEVGDEPPTPVQPWSAGASFELDTGASFRDLDDNLRSLLGIAADVEGVAIDAVRAGSSAAEEGLQPGMVVTMADTIDVSSKEELKEAIERARNKNKKVVLLQVLTRHGKGFRALPLINDE